MKTYCTTVLRHDNFNVVDLTTQLTGTKETSPRLQKHTQPCIDDDQATLRENTGLK